MKTKSDLTAIVQNPEKFPKETRKSFATVPGGQAGNGFEKQFSSVDLWKIEKKHRKAEDLRRLIS
jgi:hypothetical protein